MKEPFIVSINDLTSTTVTRARGTEAFKALVEVIKHSTIDSPIVLVDISGQKAISGSFLDELILRISEIRDSNLPKIGFHINSDSEAAKLERACSLRQTCCLYQRGNDLNLLTIQIKKELPLRTSIHTGSFFVE
jgi:hypothetical protein